MLALLGAGVLLGDGVNLVLTGRGAVALAGDSVVLGGAGVTPFAATGDAASFTVATTGSQRLRGVTLDFGAGAGTQVTLQADTGTTGSGRVRIEDSTIDTPIQTVVSGTEASFQFDCPGDFNFSCRNHGDMMLGTIHVVP